MSFYVKQKDPVGCCSLLLKIKDLVKRVACSRILRLCISLKRRSCLSGLIVHHQPDTDILVSIDF